MFKIFYKMLKKKKIGSLGILTPVHSTELCFPELLEPNLYTLLLLDDEELLGILNARNFVDFYFFSKESTFELATTI